MTVATVKALVWYKNISLPKEVLEGVGITEINERMGHLKLVEKLPQDLQAMLPPDFLELKDWTLKRG